MKAAALVLTLVSLLAVVLLAGCIGKINVMGRHIPVSERKASYDGFIVLEKQGAIAPGHDEHGRHPSWDQFWHKVGGANEEPPTSESRRLKRYIIKQRRAAGLKELNPATKANDD